MTSSPVTAFGAALTGPAQAAGVLRARAAAGGLPVLPAGDRDLAAAVLGAHSWMIAVRTCSLAPPVPPEAAAALAAVLARSSGNSAEQPLLDTTHGRIRLSRDVEDSIDARGLVTGLEAANLAALQPVLEWAGEHGGPAALVAAAMDLTTRPAPRAPDSELSTAVGSSHPQPSAIEERLDAVADVLLSTAALDPYVTG